MQDLATLLEISPILLKFLGYKNEAFHRKSLASRDSSDPLFLHWKRQKQDVFFFSYADILLTAARSPTSNTWNITKIFMTWKSLTFRNSVCAFLYPRLKDPFPPCPPAHQQRERASGSWTGGLIITPMCSLFLANLLSDFLKNICQNICYLVKMISEGEGKKKSTPSILTFH